MSKHTPGPWKVLSGGPFIVKSDDDPRMALIAVTSNYATKMLFAAEVGSCEDAANARLIAAAPELYAACKDISKRIDAAWRAAQKTQNVTIISFMRDWLNDLDWLDTAIAKAEGKEDS